VAQRLPRDTLLHIQEIGAGEGWSTALLDMQTGGYTWGIDMKEYSGGGGERAGAALQSRMRRHLTSMRDTPGFEDIRSEHALDRCLDRCTLLTMNAEETYFRDEMFAIVYSLNSFEHIPGPGRTLAEIKRVLKRGGEAYVLFHLLCQLRRRGPTPRLRPARRTLGTSDIQPRSVRRMVIELGHPPYEIDSILDNLNGWPAARFESLFSDCGMEIPHLARSGGCRVRSSLQSSRWSSSATRSTS